MMRKELQKTPLWFNCNTIIDESYKSYLTIRKNCGESIFQLLFKVVFCYNLFCKPHSCIISSSVFKATEKLGSPCHPFQKTGALSSSPVFHGYPHIPFYPPTELFLNGSEFWLNPLPRSRLAFPQLRLIVPRSEKGEGFFKLYGATWEICRKEAQRLTNSGIKYCSKL